MRTRWPSRIGLLLVLGVTVRVVAAGRAAAALGAPIDLGEVTVGLLGGLALFLYGMEQMAEALQAAAGPHLRQLLARLTRHPVAGLLTGVVVTCFMQSSGATTSMLVGLISVGLVSLHGTLPVILGAGIGGTLTPQLAALNVYDYALVFVAVGFAWWYFAKSTEARHLGWLLLAFGLMLHGLKLMGGAMAPFRDYEPFVTALGSLHNLWLAVLASALFAALIQSSSGTVGIAVMFAVQGLLPLETGIGFVLGANLGTCVTAGLASLGKPREAQRAAVSLATIKVIGVLLLAPLVGPFAELLRQGGGDGPAATARQIANANTLWNVGLALGLLPLVGWLERMVLWLLPELPEPEVDDQAPRYLDRSMLGSPALALGLVRREVGRIGNRIEKMMDLVPVVVLDLDLDRAAALPALDDQVDSLYEAIAAYLTELGQTSMSPETADEVLALITAVAELESIGDVMETNLVHTARSLAGDGAALQPEAKRHLVRYHEMVRRGLRSTIIAVVANEREAAQVVLDMKDEVTRLDAEIRAWQLEQLRGAEIRPRMSAYAVEMDILENLRRIYYHSKRVAKLVVRAEGAAAWTTASAG